MKNKLRGSLSLLLCTVIWGFAFIAQSVGMDLIGQFTFQMARCFLAVLFLIPFSFLLDLGKCTMAESKNKNGQRRNSVQFKKHTNISNNNEI